MCFVIYAFVVTNWKLASNKKRNSNFGFFILFYFIFFVPNRNLIAISFVSFEYLRAKFFFEGKFMC